MWQPTQFQRIVVFGLFFYALSGHWWDFQWSNALQDAGDYLLIGTAGIVTLNVGLKLYEYRQKISNAVDIFAITFVSLATIGVAAQILAATVAVSGQQ